MVKWSGINTQESLESRGFLLSKKKVTVSIAIIHDVLRIYVVLISIILYDPQESRPLSIEDRS